MINPSQKVPIAAVHFDGHSYLAIHLHGIDWKQARIICQKMGGDLVSINSKKEFEFIFNRIVGNKNERNLWIGGHLVNGNWQWADGSRINDSFWFKPPTIKPGFDYTYINNEGTIWNNDSPSPTIPGFIIEWDK